MSLEEFVDLLVGYRGDLSLMARGHPFTEEEILDQMDLSYPGTAEMVVLEILQRHVTQ